MPLPSEYRQSGRTREVDNDSQSKNKAASPVLGCIVLLGLAILVTATVRHFITTTVQKPVSASLSAPPVTVGASILYAAYHDNEIKANEQYNAHTLLVIGVVESINEGIGGNPTVRLYPGVECTFSSSDRPQLANLHSGQTVTIQGSCNGTPLGTVILSDCSLK